MNILGVHAFIHDSGACLISGGELRAISEERLDRRKHSAAFPSKSIRYLLDIFSLRDINEIDLIVCDMFERQGDETVKGIREEGYKGHIEQIRHHDAHAASAYFASPFDDAAVLIVDGAGSSGRRGKMGD